MKLLFIKQKNIGDALIMTPALTTARKQFPEAQIDVLVRGSTEGILKGSTAINHIYTSAQPEADRRAWNQWWHDVELLQRLRKQKYDWVFELSENNRGRTMAWLSGAKYRATHTKRHFPAWMGVFFTHKSDFDFTQVHRCEKDLELVQRFLGCSGKAPAMEFHRSFADWSWVQENVTQPPIVVHAVTRWKRKMWQPEKWRQLVQRLAEVAPVVLTSGHDAQEIALTKEIASVAPGRAKVTEGKLSWAQMAALLYGARMLVSVDTATMHLGAACQVPLVALLGPTHAVQWGPWQCPHQLIQPPLPPGGDWPDRRLDVVTVDDVWQACQKMLVLPLRA